MVENRELENGWGENHEKKIDSSNPSTKKITV